MALSDLDWLRLVLEDTSHEQLDALTGDGESQTFRLANPPARAGTLAVSIDGIAQATPADYTQPDAGSVRFTVAPVEDVHIVLAYTHVVFEDAELEHYLVVATEDHDRQLERVYKAAVLALDGLLTGAATALKFGAGSEDFDMPGVFDRLMTQRRNIAAALAGETARPQVLDPTPPE